MAGGSSPGVVSGVYRSALDRHVSRDVPDERGELARDRDADLVLVQATGSELAVAAAEAQL